MDPARTSATIPDAEGRVRASFARQSFMTLLGAEICHFAPGEVDIKVPFREDLTQQHGFFHAGATISILDSAAGYAALSLFDAGAGVLTTELKVNLLRPATGDWLVARGRVVKSGKTLSVCRSDVFADRGGCESHVATALATMIRSREVSD